MTLYGYALSSASYRVRIALKLKSLEVATVAVHLRQGEQRQPEFLKLNSQGFVPALRLDDDQVLTQSVAIIEYLEEMYPRPPLLPAPPAARARVRALCQLIACDVHPLNNLRVPQVFNARRFAVDLAAYPRIAAIDAACREIPAFADAAPERQS